MKYKFEICIFFLAFVVSSCGAAPEGNLMRDDEISASKPTPQSNIKRNDDNKTQFQEALNLAKVATNLAKSAKSEAEWKVVANQLNQAIELMKSVPKTDPNYQISQQKIVEYQKNLAKALTNQNREARKIEADRLYQQGIELLRKRQLQSAVEKFQEVLVIRQQIQNYFGYQRMRYLIGSIYEQLGQSDRAQKYYPPTSKSFSEVRSDIPEEQRLTIEKLKQISKEIKNQADQLYQQGIQQLRQDKLQQALQTFQEVLAIYKKLEVDETKVLYQIASIYEQLGESEQAEKYYQIAEPPISPTMGRYAEDVQRDDDEDPKTRADRLFKEGSQRLEKGDLEEARIAFEHVLGIRKKLGDSKGQTETLLLLAKVHDRLGNKNWADLFYWRAREIGLR